MIWMLALYLFDVKMDIFQVIFHILISCSHTLSIIACDVKYTKQPIYGYRCVATSNTGIITQWRSNRSRCAWECLKIKTCRYINHNYDTGQCGLGLGKCESLVPTVDVAVSAFGPPRDTCVHWGSIQEHGRVPVEVQDRKVRYLARIKTQDTLLVGKFRPESGTFLANNEGESVGPIHESDQRIEFLTMDSACTLPWMPYAAGAILPAGAIGGGLLPDGSTTYVCKVTRGARLVFGYYNTEAELAFYEWYGPRTKTSMDILVLLWNIRSLVHGHIHYISKRPRCGHHNCVCECVVDI